MKKPKKIMSTGIRIDQITPHISYVTYPDGRHEFLKDPLTLEDLDNMERQNGWYKAQLLANRGCGR